jgi:uncharacterized protein YfaS (alpha-2-macroglobulin family)
VHLPLDRGNRKLAVSLEAPQKMEPEQPLKVKVKRSRGQGAKGDADPVAVDVGILNITRFEPGPLRFLLCQAALRADAYDVYGRVIEKMDGQKGKLKFGGDAAPKPTRSLPKKVRLVDLFSGPVMLDDKGEAEVSLPVPDFNGSLRLMAVAASGERFGMQEAEVTVAAPLSSNWRRRASSRSATAPCWRSTCRTWPAASRRSASRQQRDGLLIRNGEQQFCLKDQQKRILRIPIEAGSALGLTEVQVRVDSPLRQDRSHASRCRCRRRRPRQTVLKRLSIAPGESVEVRDAELGGFLRQTVAATLAISEQGADRRAQRRAGLLRYPYGCAEQTTSTAYPHVFIDEAAARQFALKAYTQAQRAEMLDKAIARLAGMQAPTAASACGATSPSTSTGCRPTSATSCSTRANRASTCRPKSRSGPSTSSSRACRKASPACRRRRHLQRELGLERPPLRRLRPLRGARLRRLRARRQGKAPLSTLRQLAESQAAAHSGLAWCISAWRSS